MHDEIDSLFRLTLSLHHLNKEMEKKFRLSLVQLFVLIRIRALPATSSQALAKAIGLQPSSMTPTLRRLVRKEYIFVTEDPRDSRRKLIALTRRGNDTVERVNLELRKVWGRARGASQSNLEKTLGYLGELRQELHREEAKRKPSGSGPDLMASPRLNLRPGAADALQ